MARYRYLVFLLVIILASCAQVGTISGGEIDKSAPKPIGKRVNPLNETVLFSGNSIEMPFDEFIRLNNPSENIVMVPPGVKVNASIKGKTLFLSWEESLQPNTTYAIYLNNAVKDITESNDTLIQYVFSTGTIIDSLMYSTTVVDAWTNQPIKDCVVGLYDLDSNEIVSFSKTNSKGEAILRYLSPNSYRLVAFNDENYDLQLQDHEPLGFPINDVIKLDSSITDSVAIRFYTPQRKPILRTSKFLAPGRILLGANRTISDAKISINGQEIEPSKVKKIEDDSLIVFTDVNNVNNLEVVFRSLEINDTTKLRFTDGQKNRPFSISCKNSDNKFKPSEMISFVCNDFITTIDPSLIEITNLSDSSLIQPLSVRFEYDEIFIELNKDSLTEVSVLFKDSAIVTTHSVGIEQAFTLQLLLERKLGSIIVDLNAYSSDIVVLLIKKGETMREVAISTPSSGFTFSELFPGEYFFKIIRDNNANKKWDIGDYRSKTQAEEIDYYSTPIKVRPNWDVDVKLGE